MAVYSFDLGLSELQPMSASDEAPGGRSAGSFELEAKARVPLPDDDDACNEEYEYDEGEGDDDPAPAASDDDGDAAPSEPLVGHPRRSLLTSGRLRARVAAGYGDYAAHTAAPSRPKPSARRYLLPIPPDGADSYFRDALDNIVSPPESARKWPLGYCGRDVSLHYVHPANVSEHVGPARFAGVNIEILDPAIDSVGLPTRLDVLRQGTELFTSMRQAAATHINKETSRMLKVDSVVANHPPSAIERLQVAFLCAHLRDCLPRGYVAPCPVFNSVMPCRSQRNGRTGTVPVGAGLAGCPCTLVEMLGKSTDKQQRSRLVEDEDVADAFDRHEKPSGVQLISCTHLPWFCVSGAHVCLCCLIWGPADISVEDLTSHGFAACPRRIAMALLHLQAPPWYGFASGIPSDMSIHPDIAEAHLRAFDFGDTVVRPFALLPKHVPEDYPLLQSGTDLTQQYIAAHSHLATTRHLHQGPSRPAAAPVCAWPLPGAFKRPRSSSAEPAPPQAPPSQPPAPESLGLEELYLIMWKRVETTLDATIDYFKQRARITRDDPDVDARTLSHLWVSNMSWTWRWRNMASTSEHGATRPSAYLCDMQHACVDTYRVILCAPIGIC